MAISIPDRYKSKRTDTTCLVDTCERPVWSRGLCRTHLARWTTHGDVRANVPIQKYVRKDSK